jgi:hypothetical protein
MLNRLNQINKYNKEIRNNNKNNVNNKNRVNSHKNDNSHMSMMLLQSNTNEKYPLWTQNSYRATWPIIMPRIILEFKSKKCWDYVYPENAPVNADNNEVLENTFEEEEADVALRVAQDAHCNACSSWLMPSPAYATWPSRKNKFSISSIECRFMYAALKVVGFLSAR